MSVLLNSVVIVHNAISDSLREIQDIIENELSPLDQRVISKKVNKELSEAQLVSNMASVFIQESRDRIDKCSK